MSRTNCPTCSQPHHWRWEEAFCKFGFDDGDGLVMTEAVAEVLRQAGCTVSTHLWGCHNVIITRIERDGVSLIPDGTTIGYADPRAYLPDGLIELLDSELGEDADVEVLS
jgi:hypothetical protein